MRHNAARAHARAPFQTPEDTRKVACKWTTLEEQTRAGAIFSAARKKKGESHHAHKPHSQRAQATQCRRVSRSIANNASHYAGSGIYHNNSNLGSKVNLPGAASPAMICVSTHRVDGNMPHRGTTASGAPPSWAACSPNITDSSLAANYQGSGREGSFSGWIRKPS